MSNLTTGQETARGFQAPSNTQFSVFLDNRVGRLLDLLRVLGTEGLTLAGFSVVDSADHAVVRVLTSNGELAGRLLDRHGLPFSEAEVLVVELDEAQTLQKLCQSLLSAELNIQYAYPLLVRPRGAPAVVVHVDDMVFAGQLLRRKLFTLLAENDLGDNASRGRPDDPSPGDDPMH